MDHSKDSIRHIALSYNTADSENSALQLILNLRPEWRDTKESIEFVRFTDGITNTVRPPIHSTSLQTLPPHAYQAHC